MLKVSVYMNYLKSTILYIPPPHLVCEPPSPHGLWWLVCETPSPHGLWWLVCGPMVTATLPHGERSVNAPHPIVTGLWPPSPHGLWWQVCEAPSPHGLWWLVCGPMETATLPHDEWPVNPYHPMVAGLWTHGDCHLIPWWMACEPPSPHGDCSVNLPHPMVAGLWTHGD